RALPRAGPRHGRRRARSAALGGQVDRRDRARDRAVPRLGVPRARGPDARLRAAQPRRLRVPRAPGAPLAPRERRPHAAAARARLRDPPSRPGARRLLRAHDDREHDRERRAVRRDALERPHDVRRRAGRGAGPRLPRVPRCDRSVARPLPRASGVLGDPMPALDKLHPAQPIEQIAVPQTLSYNWEYDATRTRLMRLYENAKRDQWNATTRLDWSIDVDPEKGLVPDPSIAIWGTPMWEK